MELAELLAARADSPRARDDPVAVLGEVERLEAELRAAACLEDLTGLVGPVSGRRPPPPQASARDAAPVHVVVEERDERLDVALVEGRSSRSQAIDHQMIMAVYRRRAMDIAQVL
jgi:hypothetical protein